MKKFLQFFILCVFLVFPNLNIAQDKKPKVALVLSGGGAKGVAHIPVLQALDSLGIVPDIVIGTSMGSIVGGLYAMGYSGDSIEVMVKRIDWDVILGGTISLSNVGVEEKSEFNKYLIDLDLIEGKPKMGSALLQDQELREYITFITYPVSHITDFDDLPIPYRAMTTDIVNGQEVLLTGGNLGFAMRASMSIPGVFEPVEYKGTLLVDGGVLNNFPTDVAKQMGADIIIGSDVGGGMAKKEDLDNIMSLAFQAGMLSSNLKNPENQKRCDVLFDHVPNLTYSTGDFEKSSEIYLEGKVATNLNMDALVSVADQVTGYKQRTHEIPETVEKRMLKSIDYEGISDGNLDLVIERTNIQPGKKYKVQEWVDGIDRAMGTTRFRKITYNGVAEGDEIAVVLRGYEHSKHVVKGALHYDTYRGVGLILNYTGRNIMGKASRFFATLDIAEQPKFRLQYQKNFGNRKAWWWRAEALGEQLDQKVFIGGQATDDMEDRYFQFDTHVNRNINSLNSFVGLGFNYERTNLKPRVSPELDDNLIDLDKYHFNNFEVYLQYQYNNMNKAFYATGGTYFRAALSTSLFHEVDVEYYNEPENDVSGTTNGFSKLTLEFEKRIRFHKKITGIVGAGANFMVLDNVESDEVSIEDYGYAVKYFLGGTFINPKKYSYMFAGLNEDELVVTQFMRFNFGVQFNPAGKFFITPHIDLASVGFDGVSNYLDDAFSPKGSWQDGIETSAVWSAGGTLAYHSFLGPVTFDLSWVNGIDKARIFFGIGLQLNRSY